MPNTYFQLGSRLREAQRHALVFRLPVVDPLFPRVWGTVDVDPEPAKLDVGIVEDPLHHASVLWRPVLQDLVPVHLELKDAAMEDTVVKEHLRASVADRCDQGRCTICSCGCRLWLCPHSAKREKGRERGRERARERQMQVPESARGRL